MKDGSDAVSDWPPLNALLNTASGASWISCTTAPAASAWATPLPTTSSMVACHEVGVHTTGLGPLDEFGHDLGGIGTQGGVFLRLTDQVATFLVALTRIIWQSRPSRGACCYPIGKKAANRDEHAFP